MSRASRWIFGWSKPTLLANRRLEILRRLVIRLHHDTVDRANEEIRETLNAGFSELQVGVLVRQFARRRFGQLVWSGDPR